LKFPWRNNFRATPGLSAVSVYILVSRVRARAALVKQSKIKTKGKIKTKIKSNSKGNCPFLRGFPLKSMTYGLFVLFVFVITIW
jgi:hypothetical protein